VDIMNLKQEPGTKSPRDVTAEIHQLRDEIRLKLHLAGMDARREWDALEAKVVALEDEILGRGDRLVSATRERAAEIRKALHDFTARNLGTEATTRVGEVMKWSPKACSSEDSLERAAKIMWEEDCGAVPVLDAAGKPCAMITDRDICMAAYTRNIRLSQASVASAMSQQLFSCAMNDPLLDALRVMSVHKVRRLPVVDAEQNLVGILSLADLVRRRAVSPELFCDSLASVCEPFQQRTSPETAP
jgi:CBS domain-containing protein